MLKDLVLATRSYRGFDESRKITREELLEMLDCARLTASASNVQPLKYYIAYEEETVKTIQPITKWAKALAPLELPHPGKYPTAFIVICLDKTITPNAQVFQRDLGIVAQTIVLKATEMGLGGCMIGNFVAAELKEAIKLKEEYDPMLVIALGKPDEKVVLTEVKSDGNTAYYRDENDIHYVPKRKLEDIVLN